MQLQFHLDNLGWALRNLETFARAQLGASGEEGLARFRQTFDLLSGDLGNVAALQGQLTELSAQFNAANQRAADAEAALAQAQSQAPARTIDVGEDTALIAEASAKVHRTYNSLLLKMREFGTLPEELEALVTEASGAVDTLVMLTPQAPQAPSDSTPPPEVTGQAEGTPTPDAQPAGDGPSDSTSGAPTGSAQDGVQNSGPNDMGQQQATDPSNPGNT